MTLDCESPANVNAKPSNPENKLRNIMIPTFGGALTLRSSQNVVFLHELMEVTQIKAV